MESQPPKSTIKHSSTFNFTSSYYRADTGSRVAPQQSNIIVPRQTSQVYPQTLFESVIVPERPVGIERALQSRQDGQIQVQHRKGLANGQKQPVKLQCPFCEANIVTQISYEIGDGTQCAAFVLLIIFFPLFWLPLVKKECKNVIHRCPRSNCGKEVGRRDFKFC